MRITPPILTLSALLASCTSKESMNDAQLKEFGTRYAAAWSSQDPDRLVAFYTDDGTLTVNNGAPSAGKAAVRATVASFMSGFPNMKVVMDSMVRSGTAVRFHWTWTGTNTGPGGNGRAVNISGYEEWTLSPDGKITQSLGHYDEAEYARQMAAP